MSLKEGIKIDDIKKIFGNAGNKKNYLDKKGIEYKKSSSSSELNKLIEDNWDYEKDKKIVREIYFENNKYLTEKQYLDLKNYLVLEWTEKFGEEVSWPFSQGGFDDFIQRVHTQYSNDSFDKSEVNEEVDEIVSKAAIKFRRIKFLNTIINDYIEKMIIESNEDIIPTCSNSKSVDYYIDGVRFDQKVSKSPTKEFIGAYGEDTYKDYAKENPQEVARFLYQYQDEERFGSEKRLFVVFLDKVKLNVDFDTLKNYLLQIETSSPYEIEFEYKHKSSGIKKYKTSAFVILI